jgi:hypothetical protein
VVSLYWAVRGNLRSYVVIKIGLLDIETAPNVGYVWGKYDQNVIEFVQNWYMLSWSWKWLDDPKVECRALCDYDNYTLDLTDDQHLVQDLWERFDEADIIVAHNGDAFDIKRSNARFITHSLPPPRPYKTVDTLKVARKHFKFESNKLGDLGQHLDLGTKAANMGFKTWKGCMEGDPQAWKTMKKYNAQDTLLLEQVYLKLRPWATTHPDLNVFGDGELKCPTCQSGHIQKRGFSIARTRKYQRLHCQGCGHWFAGELLKD